MKIALAGNIGSGKSTIAKEFEKRGYYLLNYAELIKEEVAKALVLTNAEIEQDVLDKIHKEKEFYRPLLIAWADTTGWSTGERLRKILPTINKENIVMDNVRFLKQAEIVKNSGFKISKLEGGDRNDIPELANFHFDAEIPWMGSVEERMEYILKLLSG